MQTHITHSSHLRLLRNSQAFLSVRKRPVLIDMIGHLYSTMQVRFLTTLNIRDLHIANGNLPWLYLAVRFAHWVKGRTMHVNDKLRWLSVMYAGLWMRLCG